MCPPQSFFGLEEGKGTGISFPSSQCRRHRVFVHPLEKDTLLEWSTHDTRFLVSFVSDRFVLLTETCPVDVQGVLVNPTW